MDEKEEERLEFVRSFRIDDGELDGLSPQKCFVMGYELAVIERQLECPEAIDQPIRPENTQRIEDVCRESGRPYKLMWLGEQSETWMRLVVAPKDEPKDAAGS